MMTRKGFFSTLIAPVAAMATGERKTPAPPKQTEVFELWRELALPPVPWKAKTISEFIATDPIPHFQAESEEANRFIAGVQWEHAIVEARAEQRRPALTVNRLPEFLAHMRNATRPEDLTEGNLERARVVFYRRVRDLQCMYNYTYSTLVEAIPLRDSGQPQQEAFNRALVGLQQIDRDMKALLAKG